MLLRNILELERSENTSQQKLRYIKTSNLTLVFGHWNQILFAISGSKNESVAYLRFQLQMLHDIAVFLLGSNYAESIRGTTIRQKNINAYQTYVDTFLKMIDTDPKYQLNIIPHESFYTDISKYILSKVLIKEFPQEIPFVECLIFRNHTIIARLSLSNPYPLDDRSIFLLSLVEQNQYSSCAEIPDENHIVDHIFITSLGDPSKFTSLSCYLYVYKTLEKCSIYSTQFAKDSPYTAVFVTKNETGPHSEDKKSDKKIQILDIINLISQFFQEAITQPRINFSVSVPGLVYTLSINRTNGQSFDYEPCPDAKNHQITQLLLKTMKNHSFDALLNGKNIMIWSDQSFLFLYMIVFLDKTGKFLTPSSTVEISPFKDDANISYSSIGSQYFPSDENVQVFEIYSIYLNTIPPNMAYIESIDIFFKMISQSRLFIDGNINIPFLQNKHSKTIKGNAPRPRNTMDSTQRKLMEQSKYQESYP